MKRFVTSLLVLVTVLTLLHPTMVATSASIWDGSVSSGFASGNGTQSDPFVIETADQLAYLSQTVNNRENSFENQYIILTADIYLNDISNVDWMEHPLRWSSIGYYDLSYEAYKTPGFYGTFDGNGHTIFGLYSEYEYTSIGLFGYIGSAGIVKNLTIAKSEVIGNLGTGAIAGYCEGTIQNCANLGNVYSNGSYVGGIVGSADPRAVIELCYNGGNVQSDGYFVGGISGSEGNIRNCYNYGTVSGSQYVGGICGSWGVTSITSMVCCYNIGTVTSSEAYAGAIIGQYRGNKASLPQNCYYLYGSVIDGYGTTQNGIGCEYLGVATIDSTNATTALMENQLGQKESYPGFDFEKIWSVTSSTSYPAPVFKQPSYSQTYGWCLTNNWYSYGYKTPYRIPFPRYCETYGYSAGLLIEGSVGRILPWNGSCFGLSLLSLAQYYNIIDLAPYFNQTGNYLYDFGYESIYHTDEGNECFTIEGNAEAIKLIERAMVSQDSVEISECEIFKNDNDYSDLLDFLYSDEAKPIMVSIMSGTFAHTMVITTDTTPYKITSGSWAGYYAIPLYDCNAPSNSDLLHSPTDDYEQNGSVLLVNPTTSEWKYTVNQEVKYSNKYASLLGDVTDWGHSIWYYDISQLDSNYFTEPLNLWHRRIQIQISGSSVEINNNVRETLLKIRNGEVEAIADNCLLRIPSGGNEETAPYFVFYTDSSQLNIASESAGILIMNKGYMAALNLNDAYSAAVDFNSNTLVLTGLSSDGRFDVCLQDQTQRAIALTGENVKDKTISLVLDGDSATILADTPKQNLDYRTENLSKKNILVKIAGHKESDKKTTATNNGLVFVLLPIGLTLVIILIIGLVLIIVIPKKKVKVRSRKPTCVNCGALLADGEQYCTSCGKRIH